MGVDTLAYQYWLDITITVIKTMNQHIASGGSSRSDLPPNFYFQNHPIVNKSYNINQWDKSFIQAKLSDEKVCLTPKRMVAELVVMSHRRTSFCLRSAFNTYIYH